MILSQAYWHNYRDNGANDNTATTVDTTSTNHLCKQQMQFKTSSSQCSMVPHASCALAKCRSEKQANIPWFVSWKPYRSKVPTVAGKYTLKYLQGVVYLDRTSEIW